MYAILISFVVAVLAQGPALKPEQTAAMAPVRQFITAFNKGDVKSAVAACADQTSIIDEFAPYEWHGQGACAKWAADFDAWAKKGGITDGAVTLGTPKFVEITGDRAYIVVPTDFAFKDKGKATKETGAMLTVALTKTAAGWRMTAWTWSKN